DALKSSAVPGSAGFGGGVLKPQAACALRRERLVDGHRMVDELQLRRKERELHAIAGQRMQRQERLESCDAAPRDEHARARALFTGPGDRTGTGRGGTAHLGRPRDLTASSQGATKRMMSGCRLASNHCLRADVAAVIDPAF